MESEQYFYDQHSFISDVGGIIGLLFGMSVISAYDWFVEKAAEIGLRRGVMKKRRRQLKVEDIQLKKCPV